MNRWSGDGVRVVASEGFCSCVVLGPPDFVVFVEYLVLGWDTGVVLVGGVEHGEVGDARRSSSCYCVGEGELGQ